MCCALCLPRILQRAKRTLSLTQEVLDDIYDKMATPTPTLAEKLDKIKSPGLQSQKKVSILVYSEIDIRFALANFFVCA